MLLSKLPKTTSALTKLTRTPLPANFFLARSIMSTPDKSTVRKTTLSTGNERVDYPGYNSSIAAAVVVPAGRRLVATSGMLGHSSETGKFPEALVDEFTNAFEKIQKSLQAVEPSLSSDELFACIYSVNTYHVGDIQDPIINRTVGEAASKFFKGPLPAWTGVEVKGLSMGARFEVQVKAALP